METRYPQERIEIELVTNKEEPRSSTKSIKVRKLNTSSANNISSSVDICLNKSKIVPVLIRNSDICRICLETEEESEEKLIKPCFCIGSSQSVHEKCLKQWIKARNIQITKKLAVNCDICKKAISMNKQFKFRYSSEKAAKSISNYFKSMTSLFAIYTFILIFYLVVIARLFDLSSEADQNAISIYMSVIILTIVIYIIAFLCSFNKNCRKKKFHDYEIISRVVYCLNGA